MKSICFSVIVVLLGTTLSAQEGVPGHFLVEFEQFSPPSKDLITSFEGQPAEAFLATDVQGVEHFLGSYKGKRVILWFWSIDSSIAKEQMGAMTLLQERNQDVQLISFAKEPKVQVQEYIRVNPVQYPVIPNGEIFGQMAYGAELGSPRMFLIDKEGVIKVVLPEEAFSDNSKLLISLESILKNI